MKDNDLDQALERKLELVRSEFSRGAYYTADPPDGPISLPAVLIMASSDGASNDQNWRSVAKALGLREQELTQMVQCSIGRRCATLALAIRLLRFAQLKYEEEGVLFRPALLGMVQSVERLLERLPSSRSPTDAELQLMERCSGELAELMRDPVLCGVSRRILDLTVIHADTA